MLRARASASVGVVGVEHYRPLNRNEKTGLRALIHYAAKTRPQSAAQLEVDLQQQFTFESLDDFTLAQMNATRQYLQNFIPRQIAE
ncbi:MAG: hypothetical protein KBA75_08490 [Alphaproteobacteria bacterium]|nr:hypothetical protein [Alphaproteobacteria bacterium]